MVVGSLNSWNPWGEPGVAKAKCLEGSCHCGCIKFKVQSRTPYPFVSCYCTACRKTFGGAGATACILGDANTLDVKGADKVAVYRTIVDGKPTGRLRHHCKMCSCELWLWGPPEDPKHVEVFAGAVDTPLPVPPERYHVFLCDKPGWVYVPPKDLGNHKYFKEGPDMGFIEWHKAHGLLQGPAEPPAGAEAPVLDLI